MASGILIVFFHACFLFLSVGCESNNGTGSSAGGTGRSAEGGVLVGAGGTTLCLGVLPGCNVANVFLTVFCARFLGLSVGWESADGTGISAEGTGGGG